MSKYVQKLISILAILAGTLIITAPSMALAAAPAAPAANSATKAAICEGVGKAGGSGDCATTGGPDVNSVVGTVINILSFVVGIAAVIMIIIGGFKYIIASGDSSNIKSAKDTILYAIIGLVVVAVAQVIVRFVLNNVG